MQFVVFEATRVSDRQHTCTWYRVLEFSYFGTVLALAIMELAESIRVTDPPGFSDPSQRVVASLLLVVYGTPFSQHPLARG